MQFFSILSVSNTFLRGIFLALSIGMNNPINSKVSLGHSLHTTVRKESLASFCVFSFMLYNSDQTNSIYAFHVLLAPRSSYTVTIFDESIFFSFGQGSSKNLENICHVFLGAWIQNMRNNECEGERWDIHWNMLSETIHVSSKKFSAAYLWKLCEKQCQIFRVEEAFISCFRKRLSGITWQCSIFRYHYLLIHCTSKKRLNHLTYGNE